MQFVLIILCGIVLFHDHCLISLVAYTVLPRLERPPQIVRPPESNSTNPF